MSEPSAEELAEWQEAAKNMLIAHQQPQEEKGWRPPNDIRRMVSSGMITGAGRIKMGKRFIREDGTRLTRPPKAKVRAKARARRKATRG